MSRVGIVVAADHRGYNTARLLVPPWHSRKSWVAGWMSAAPTRRAAAPRDRIVTPRHPAENMSVAALLPGSNEAVHGR